MDTTRTATEKRNLESVFNFLRRIGARISTVDKLEEEQYRLREGFDRYHVEVIEDKAPDRIFGNLREDSSINLNFFEASVQRTQLVGHFLYDGYEIPAHYCIIGALILERQGRRFRVWEKPKTLECILAPKKFLADSEELINAYGQDASVPFFDSGGVDLDYTQLRIAAVNFARTKKWDLRSELIQQWNFVNGGKGNLLLINDTILAVSNLRLTYEVAGFVKMTYVPFKGRENLPIFLSLDAYKRGVVMKIEEPSNPESVKYSWFLRLRDPYGQSPEFGLVRIEIVAKSDNEAISKANELSEAIARERLPVTYPATDWDKLIFPHKLAEQYVESLFPTRETIRAYFRFA